MAVDNQKPVFADKRKSSASLQRSPSSSKPLVSVKQHNCQKSFNQLRNELVGSLVFIAWRNSYRHRAKIVTGTGKTISFFVSQGAGQFSGGIKFSKHWSDGCSHRFVRDQSSRTAMQNGFVQARNFARRCIYRIGRARNISGPYHNAKT